MGNGRTAIVIVTLVVAAGLGAVLAPDRVPQPASSSVSPSLPIDGAGPELITVYVSGWVASPGLVQVEPGSLVADVVAAAGGARTGAALAALNLAAPVNEGDQVSVPGPGGAQTDMPNAGGGGLVDLNRADETELQTLPGVGPVLASRIVAHREANGPFVTVEDLLDVSGIGEAKLGSIADLVVVS